MSNLAIAMIAAPRRAMTVAETVTSLRFGGFDEQVHVFAEPGTETGSLQDVVDHRNPRRLGALDNWLGAIAWLLANTRAEHLLVVEDDVAYCRGARKAVDQVIEGNHPYGFLGLCTQNKEADRLGMLGPGWVAMKFTDVWGTQAVCFNRSTVARMLPWARKRRRQPRSICYDYLMQEYYRQHAPSHPCYYHVPSLCEYVGWLETTIEKPRELGFCPRDEQPLRRGLGFDPEYIPGVLFPADGLSSARVEDR